MRLFYLAGYVAGTVVKAALVRPSAADENHALRAKNRDLTLENAVLRGESTALAEIADDLQRQLAMTRHPSAGGFDAPMFTQPITVGEFGDAMAVLDDPELCLSDLLWQWGGEVK